MIDINNFIELLDNIDDLIDISLVSSLNENSENLEVGILSYINKNYPFILISKGPILEIAENGYKTRTIKFKENMKFKVADIRYKLNENIIEIIQDEIDKLNKLFTSITLGSNFNYLDYIEDTVGNIMKLLVEKSHGSMVFARNSMSVRKDVETMISSYYLNTMRDYGENLKINFKISQNIIGNTKTNY
ncbi:MAG: hypothetical protein NC181_02500 [Clostridium sp.]|nr:hypothetical protein [Clostridium sp.]MCM1444169.1 hypothetical protein [Candidatus Amulumruptor caecigallinarius]